MEKLGSYWKDFHEIWYLRFSRKSAEKIQVSLRSSKNNGYLNWRLVHIMINISPNSFFNYRCFRQKLQKKWKHVFNDEKRFSENRDVYEIMWKKYGTAEHATDDSIIGRMRFACWITKVADTHSEYKALTAYLHERTPMLRYTYIDCFVNYRFCATCFDPLWTIIEKLQVTKKGSISRYNTVYINKLIMHVKVQKL
jgi:hypothetical protein